MQRRQFIQAAGALPLAALARAAAVGGPELYAGEKALYEAARKEGMCVSFDTGPEWANWKALFREFKQRYPDIELTYNDLGSAATVVALERCGDARRPTPPITSRPRRSTRRARTWWRLSAPWASSSCPRCSARPKAAGSRCTR